MKMNKRDNVKPMSNGTKLLKATVEMNLLKALADDMLCVYHIGDGGRIEMHRKAKDFRMRGKEGGGAHAGRADAVIGVIAGRDGGKRVKREPC